MVGIDNTGPDYSFYVKSSRHDFPPSFYFCFLGHGSFLSHLMFVSFIWGRDEGQVGVFLITITQHQVSARPLGRLMSQSFC